MSFIFVLLSIGLNCFLLFRSRMTFASYRRWLKKRRKMKRGEYRRVNSVIDKYHYKFLSELLSKLPKNYAVTLNTRLDDLLVVNERVRSPIDREILKSAIDRKLIHFLIFDNEGIPVVALNMVENEIKANQDSALKTLITSCGIVYCEVVKLETENRTYSDFIVLDLLTKL